MGKFTKAKPAIEIIEDHFLKTEDVQKILSCSDSHVYMLAKTGQILEVDISCAGNGGPNTKRYSLHSVNALIRKRKKNALERQNFSEA